VSSPAAKTWSDGGSAWDRYGPGLLMIGPLLLFLLVFYLVPFGNMVAESLSYSSGDAGARAGLTLHQYIKTFESGRVGRVLTRTFRIALVTVAITLVISYPIALLLLRSGRVLRTAILLVTFVSLASSLIVRNYGWVVVLADGGPVNSALIGLGITDAPLRMMYSEGAIVVGLVHFSMPFMILPIYGALLRVPPSLREASLSLGGGEWRSFFRIVFPLTMPGVFGGTMLTFAASMSAFVTPLMLGSPPTAMISQMAAEQLLIQLNFAWGSAIIVVLTVLTFLFVTLYAVALKKMFRVDV
jgi:ABC-type spermidine/putrescine transport system permease subunit I